jgi:ribosomal protein L16 Arg81 hydroxylase
VLERFTAVHSVDVVTTPGAGGGFDTLLESERKISASESDAESHKKEEQMELPKELTAALDALVESSKKNADAVAKLVERAEAEDKEKADLAEAARREAEEKTVDPLDVAKQLAESGLTPAAQARVLDAVKAGKELTEAITAEKDYSKSILEAAEKNFSGHEVTDLKETKVSIGTSIYG